MGYLNIANCQNIYLLPDQRYTGIVEMIDRYLGKLKDASVEKMTEEELIGSLGVLAELYPLLEDRNLWMDYSFALLTSVRKHIYHGDINGIALYNGLCNIALFTKNLFRATGHYQRFCHSLNGLIVKGLKERCAKIEERGGVSPFDYDVINGLSGIGSYFLDSLEEQGFREGLMRILAFFVSLSEYLDWDGSRVPGWFVSPAYTKWGNYDTSYPEGYINFSLSHGIAGPLSILMKAERRDVTVSGQRDAIERIVMEYKRVSDIPDKFLCTDIISLDDYLRKQKRRENKRQSWCYGTLGVARILMDAAEFIGDIRLRADLDRIIQASAVQPVDELMLTDPIVCHGYAGTAGIFRMLYTEKKQTCFLQQAVRLLDKIMESYSDSSLYGFETCDAKMENGNRIWTRKQSNSFLDGAAGIIMELSAWIKTDIHFTPMLLL